MLDTVSRDQTAAGDACDESTDAFVARQPIFDRSVEVVGYELLFRSGQIAQAAVSDGTQATAQLIVNTFMEIGLETLVGAQPAFVNCTREFLLSDAVQLLPPDKVFLEILEDVAIDQELVDAVRGYQQEGFKIVLDDFVHHPEWEPLVELADIVKLDVLGVSAADSQAQLTRLRPYGVKILAEKVETQADYDALRAAGFDYFQGYFFAKPQVVQNRRLPESHLGVLRLLARLSDPEIEIDEVHRLVTENVGLSYKVLRFINSAFFALPQKVDSIHRGVVYFGLEQLKRWVSLLVLAGVDGKPYELFRIALVRARHCEQLGEMMSCSDSSAYFTAGLFSTLDALLDVPMQELIASLPLTEELTVALTTHSGPIGEAVRCAIAYERQDWPRVTFADLDGAVIRDAYVAAVDWSTQTSSNLQTT